MGGNDVTYPLSESLDYPDRIPQRSLDSSATEITRHVKRTMDKFRSNLTNGTPLKMTQLTPRYPVRLVRQQPDTPSARGEN
jgi:hypothetical protein